MYWKARWMEQFWITCKVILIINSRIQVLVFYVAQWFNPWIIMKSEIIDIQNKLNFKPASNPWFKPTFWIWVLVFTGLVFSSLQLNLFNDVFTLN